MSTITMQTIRCAELQQKIASGEAVELIDVRTPVEFREVKVPQARNEPLDSVNPQAIIAQRADSAAPLYVMCRSGGRAAKAIEKFHSMGFNNAINVEGGMLGWEEAQLPVVRGKKAISLERQVRIVAGSLVFIGAMLGYFIDPLWIFLSAFIGAGLTFAGITDTCGMGMMLAKMPWNRVKSDSTGGPACSA